MKTLRDIPAVRALAEKEAREAHNATVAAIKDQHPGTAGQRMLDGLPPKWASVAAHLDLLCNLERPASRDALRSRVLTACDIPHDQGTHLGRYTCGEHCCDGDTGRMVPCSRPVWSLMGNDGIDPVIFADCPDPDEWDGDERRHVPGISAVTDPAEALRLIAIAVLGGPRG